MASANELGTSLWTRANTGRGRWERDADGNVVYIAPDGKVNYASTAGLENYVTENIFDQVGPTSDLELMNIYSEMDKLPYKTNADIAGLEFQKAQYASNERLLPSQERATIATNDLTTRQSEATGNTLQSWADATNTTNNLTSARNMMQQNLVGLEGNAAASGYDTSISNNTYQQAVNRENTGLLPYQSNTARTGYELQTAQNQSGQRLIPSNERAALAANDYNTDTYSMNQRLNPALESATRSGYDLTASLNNAQNSLIPKRTAATNRFIDESMTGKSVTGAMNEASADVGMAYKGAQDAKRRQAARMGLMPSMNSLYSNDDSLDMARLNVGARANARRTAELDNLNKLGAVALMQ